MARDPVVAAHYVGFDLAKARFFRVQQARAVYVSYRRGDDVFWTSKKLCLAVGETLITDGHHISRTRCGNEISDLRVRPSHWSPNRCQKHLIRRSSRKSSSPSLLPSVARSQARPYHPSPPVCRTTYKRRRNDRGAWYFAGLYVSNHWQRIFAVTSDADARAFSIILLSTGLGVVYLFRRLRKT